MRAIFSVLFFLSTFLPAFAQETNLPEEARYRIDYLVGTWDVYEDTLDEDGNVIGTSHATHIIEYFLGDSVLQTTAIPDQGEVRKTIRFYDKELETFYEIGVGKEGDVWILTGDLETYHMTFKGRKPQANGSYILGRFFHTNFQPNSFEAILEISRDGGETWTKVPRNQRIVRRVKPE